MMTFNQFAAIPKLIPASASWYLSDLGEAKGKQELFPRQAPQKLKALREQALIESAVSSNRIEGVTVEPNRVKAVVLGKALLQDRDEEEVRGYRLDQAIDALMEPFTLAELEQKYPRISRDMVRKVLREMQKKGLVECLGRGPGALWQRKGITLKRG